MGGWKAKALGPLAKGLRPLVKGPGPLVRGSKALGQGSWTLGPDSWPAIPPFRYSSITENLISEAIAESDNIPSVTLPLTPQVIIPIRVIALSAMTAAVSIVPKEFPQEVA